MKLSLACLALTTVGTCIGRADVLDTLADLHRRAESYYALDRLVSYNTTYYDAGQAVSTRPSTHDSELVAGRRHNRLNSVFTNGKDGAVTVQGWMWQDDEYYSLKRGQDGRYQVVGHFSASKDAARIRQFVGSCRYCYPISAGGGQVLTQYVQTLREEAGKGRDTVISAGPSSQPGTMYQVTFRHTFGGKPYQSTSYYDAQGLFRFSVDTGRIDPKTRAVVARERRVEAEYGDVRDGYPVPKGYKVWVTRPGGTRALDEEVVVTKFERYTPTADDFDLEKQFGVKPLPKSAAAGGATATARRRGWWLYAGAAGLGLATLGLVVYRLRRRAQAA